MQLNGGRDRRVRSTTLARPRGSRFPSITDSTDARDRVAEELGRLRRMRFDDLAARTQTPPEHREALTRSDASFADEGAVGGEDEIAPGDTSPGDNSRDSL
jgi:hypothetical protein